MRDTDTLSPRIMKANEAFLPMAQYLALLDQLKAFQKVNEFPSCANSSSNLSCKRLIAQ